MNTYKNIHKITVDLIVFDASKLKKIGVYVAIKSNKFVVKLLKKIYIIFFYKDNQRNTKRHRTIEEVEEMTYVIFLSTQEFLSTAFKLNF